MAVAGFEPLLAVSTAILAVAAVALLVGAWALLRRRTPTSQATEPTGVGSEALPGNEASLSPGERLARAIEALRERRGLEDLEDFDLVGDLPALHRRAVAELGGGEEAGQGRIGPAVEDRTVRLALQASIQRLGEPEVPREIAGQRLAAVITKCREAADWTDLPETAAEARRCLEERPWRPPGNLA